MKPSKILLYAFAFIGLIFMGNLAHEATHYFEIRANPNTEVTDFCAFAIPIPENNYSKVGFVKYEYEVQKDTPIPKFNETKPILAENFFQVAMVLLYGYLLKKEL